MKHFSESMYAAAKPSIGTEYDAAEFEDPQRRASVQGIKNTGTSATADDSDTLYLLKPMSCPLHLSLIFENYVCVLPSTDT